MFSEMIENPDRHPAVYLFYTGAPGSEDFQPLYVGSSTQPGKRKKDHIRNLKKGEHKNKRLQEWFDNHGDELKFRVEEFLSSPENFKSNLYRRGDHLFEDQYKEYIINSENKWIDIYKPFGICNYRDANFSSWGCNKGRKKSQEEILNNSEGAKKSYDNNLRGLRSSDNRKRWSNKVLVVGDIHLDTTILPRVERLFVDGNYDRLIFIGDELDSFYIDKKNSYTILDQLVYLKERYNKHHQRFVWIAGNHTLSYASDTHCSGFDRSVYKDVSGRLRHLIREGHILPHYQYKGVLYSHAGFTNDWMNTVEGKDKKDKLKTLLSEWKDTKFSKFQSVGTARGGYGVPSCLWADQAELLSDPLRTGPSNKTGKPFMWRQVVGHTPVRQIESYEDSKIWFIDTFSTYRNGERIGDETILEVVNGEEFNVIKL